LCEKPEISVAKDKFHGSAQISAVRAKLWALLISMIHMHIINM